MSGTVPVLAWAPRPVQHIQSQRVDNRHRLQPGVVKHRHAPFVVVLPCLGFKMCCTARFRVVMRILG